MIIIENMNFVLTERSSYDQLKSSLWYPIYRNSTNGEFYGFVITINNKWIDDVLTETCIIICSNDGEIEKIVITVTNILFRVEATSEEFADNVLTILTVAM